MILNKWVRSQLPDRNKGKNDNVCYDVSIRTSTKDPVDTFKRSFL